MIAKSFRCRAIVASLLLLWTTVPIFPAQAAGQAASSGGQPALSSSVSVEPQEARRQIEGLTRQILLKEIELGKFNLRYSQEAAKQGRWKGWRYAGFQEINNGLGLAGGIISTVERGSNLRTPTKVNIKVQESANYIPMIGSIIGAAAAVLEFGINEYHEIQARRKGFSPTAARKYVHRTKEEIVGLLERRRALIEVEKGDPSLALSTRIDVKEDMVLQDLLDQYLLEYQRFHIGARKLLAFQQTQYLFDCTKYTLNAIGAYMAFQSLNKGQRVYNGKAGVMFDISGPIYIVGPVLSRLIAKGVGAVHRHYLHPTIEAAERRVLEDMIKHCTELDKLISEGGPADRLTALLDRSDVYGCQTMRFDDEYRQAEKSSAKAKLTATQNIGAGVYVGGSKLAGGILFTIPGYNRNYNGKTFRASRVTNDDLFTSAVIGLPATAFSILDTLRIQVKGEINRRQLLEAGMHPSQLVPRRLRELEDLEAKLKAASK